MSYLALKYVHILSMVLLFGTGLGSAFYKWMADRDGDVRYIAKTNNQIVLADWIFTTPVIIIQPITGIYLALAIGVPLSSPWIITSLVLYLIAGLCWLPVVWLQIRMRTQSNKATETGAKLPRTYWHHAKLWFYLGIPAFIAMLLIVFLMVFKPTFGG